MHEIGRTRLWYVGLINNTGPNNVPKMVMVAGSNFISSPQIVPMLKQNDVGRETTDFPSVCTLLVP